MQSMHMKKPWDDVALVDGEGYGVEDMPYREHLAESVEIKQVIWGCAATGTLVNAITSEVDMPKSQGSQCWGVIVHKLEVNWSWNMCLWKAWLLYSSLFGRFSERGEASHIIYVIMELSYGIIHRQMNIDYSICEVLKYFTAGLLAALIIYDIACQWWINFLMRVKASQHLSFPPGMKLLTAVGSFHLSSHVPQCFALFSLHFMQGSSQIDGEILETLWKEFNKVSPSTKPMSASHRREVCDDFMWDSNWKKLVGICT